MTYEKLKEFCNSLTEDQLKQEVSLSIVDSHYEKVAHAMVSEEDEYFDHGDSLGSLEDIKNEYPDDWEDVVAGASLCPKGTVFLINDY